MKSRIFVLVIILVISLFTGCYEEVKLRPMDIPPRLAVYSLFRPDTVFWVRVGRSVAVNEFDRGDTLLWLDDAVCSLYVNNHFLEVLSSQGKGYYTSPDDYYPQPGQKYKIVVTHPVYGRVQAESSVPTTSLNMVSVHKEDTAYTDADGWPVAFLQVNVNNSLDNEYNVQLFLTQCYLSYHHLSPDDSVRVKICRICSINRTLPPITSAIALEYHQSIVFPSSLLNNGLNSLKLYYYPSIVSYINHRRVYMKNLQVYLRILSPEYYNYLLSKDNLDRTDYGDDEIFSLPDPPFNLYTNVEGGFGIFAGYINLQDTTTYPVSMDY